MFSQDRLAGHDACSYVVAQMTTSTTTGWTKRIGEITLPDGAAGRRSCAPVRRSAAPAALRVRKNTGPGAPVRAMGKLPWLAWHGGALRSRLNIQSTR